MEEARKRMREELQPLAEKIRTQGETVEHLAVRAEQVIDNSRVVVETARRVRAVIEARRARFSHPQPQ